MATQARLNQIADLVTQWEQLAGYAVQDIPQWAIDLMAGNKYNIVNTLYDIGQFMAHFVGEQSWQIKPQLDWGVGQWAFYGMTASEYGQRVASFNDVYLRTTGQAVAPQSVIDQALSQQQGQMTSGEFQNFLLSQDSFKNTYGWLRYGLDFQQFQQQKLQMRTSFGRDLTDAEAVTQLQFLHAAQGQNASASLQPTLTQVEKKAAQTGISASVVR